MGKLIRGINDLETYCKKNNMIHLLNEWDYKKNGDLKPCDLTWGSEKKVWWIVEHKDDNTGKNFTFEWETAVAYRTAGRGCPYLSNPAKAIYVGFNDLTTTDPLLSKEWDYEKNDDLTPQMVTRGCNKKVWWICDKGHSFDASVVNRAKGRGCPFCKGKKVLKGFNDLATTNPHLAQEWDYEKNGDLSPDKISKGSSVKIWWKCENGHSFASTIPNRINANVNCPYCSERTVVVGKNDLATTYPQLSKEWDYEKNDDLTPQMVTKGSNKIVWWICDKGHSYDAYVCNRTNGSQCPYCSGRRIGVGINDLTTTNPEIVKEWDFSKNKKRIPQNYKNDSRERVWWVCNNNHSYELSIRDRSRGLGCPFCDYNRDVNDEDRVLYRCENGHNIAFSTHINNLNMKCPYCNKKIIVLLSDSFEKTRPEIAKEWDTEKNSDVLRGVVACGSNKIVWWKCKKGHSWRAAISARALSGSGCPYCSGRKAIQGKTDLCTTNPELASEWNYEKNGSLTPKMFSKGSGKKVWWICKQGHTWQDTIISRSSDNCGCPYCSGHQVLAGYNDLATTNPEIANEWDYEKNGKKTPLMFSKGSNKKMWWICSKGHSYYAMVGARTQGQGCPYCNGRKVLAGFNDLATTNPELLKEWDYEKNDKVMPQMLSKGSNKNVWWICDKNHSYKASVPHKVDGRGCPFCSGKKILKGYNDLATTHPQLAKEWDYELNGLLTPDKVSKGQSKKVWWYCNNGHSYKTDILSRTSGYGCPYCSVPAKKVLSGYNDLETRFPDIAKEWHPTKNGNLMPNQVLGGANKNVWWLCSNGHEWKAILCSRTSNNVGCPLCSGSKTERLLYELLTRNNYEYDEERRFKNTKEVKNYPFDIYLPKENIIIEADGIQHFTDDIAFFESVPFKVRVKHDNTKNSFCAGTYNDEVIPILRIPYIYSPINDSILIEKLVLDFIKNKIVPQQILDFYKEYKDSIGNNYYETASYINEIIKKMRDR